MEGVKAKFEASANEYIGSTAARAIEQSLINNQLEEPEFGISTLVRGEK